MIEDEGPILSEADNEWFLRLCNGSLVRPRSPAIAHPYLAGSPATSCLPLLSAWRTGSITLGHPVCKITNTPLMQSHLQGTGCNAKSPTILSRADFVGQHLV